MRIRFSIMKVMEVVKGYKTFKDLVEGIKMGDRDRIYRALRNIMRDEKDENVRMIADMIHEIATSGSEGEVYEKVREKLRQMGVPVDNIDDIVEFINDVAHMFKREFKKVSELLSEEKAEEGAEKEGEEE